MSQKKYVSLNRLSTFLDNLYAKFAEATHKHVLADITDYKVDAELSPTSTNPVQNKIIDAEFDAVSDAMNALEAAVDEKQDKLTGTEDQFVSFNTEGKAIAIDKPYAATIRVW